MVKRDAINSFFELSENIIYVVIALFLLITSLFLIYNIILTFLHFNSTNDFLRWIVEVLDQILLMLMVIEILYTVRVSFTQHSLRTEPFLIVALIAAIRRILVISVEVAHVPEKFDHFMIEISIIGILVFIFVLSIILLRRQKLNSA